MSEARARVVLEGVRGDFRRPGIELVLTTWKEKRTRSQHAVLAVAERPIITGASSKRPRSQSLNASPQEQTKRYRSGQPPPALVLSLTFAAAAETMCCRVADAREQLAELGLVLFDSPQGDAGFLLQDVPLDRITQPDGMDFLLGLLAGMEQQHVQSYGSSMRAYEIVSHKPLR
eukprot:6481153-Amphidinium_carterae.1